MRDIDPNKDNLERSRTMLPRVLVQDGVLRGVVLTVWCAVLFLVAAPAEAQYQWEAVVGGGAATDNGFGDLGNQATGVMAVFNGRLFVAVGGDTRQAFQLWWTDDGTNWNKHPDDGFGDADNEGVAAMAVFDGYLYAGTTNVSGSGSQVFRTNDGVVWTEVNSNGFANVNNRAVTCMTVYDGQLVAGTENEVTGGQIWRTSNGTLWLPVMINGFGLISNRAVASLQGFGTRLYAGTFRESMLYNQPGELWWTDDLTNWSSSVTPGFGDNYNIAIASLTVFDGYLFAGTTQLNYLLGATGCEVWRWNGTIWQMAGTNGFGSNQSTSAIRFYHYNGELLLGIDNPDGGKLMRFVDLLDWDTLVTGGFGNALNKAIAAGEVFNSSLFLGTYNSGEGCEVHRGKVPPMFEDGFESGDTTAWSATVP